MGTLYIVSTPIGNLEDITIRALKTLFSVGYIACEDTRRTGQLLTQLVKCHPELVSGSKPSLISYYDEIELKRIPQILNLIQKGKDIALVSDSGTPLISDPGFKLVRECLKQDIKIISTPGPTSLISALTVSGLPTDKFIFLGYTPGKKEKRLKFFKSILSDMRPLRYKYTVIFFEAPHRLKPTLYDIKEVFGDIEVVAARELTKIHEEVLRGKISDLENKTDTIKGEIVLLFSIPPK